MSLKEKISQIKKKEVEEIKIDWKGRKNWWIKEVDKLHESIAEWLDEYIKSEDISIQTSAKTLKEETLGEYKVNSLCISIGQSMTLLLLPIGSVIIGGYGRIDLYRQGQSGERFMLLLTKVEETENYKWVIANKKSRRKFEELTSEVFEEVMEILIDG